VLSHYLDLASPYLHHYGYLAVFGMVLVEGFGLPAPGQTMIIAGGLLAARGDMHIAVLVTVAWSAAVLGDNIGFAIGRYGGRQLVLRHGGRAGLQAAHLEHVERFFARYGGGIVIAARFLEVLRQLNGVVAGFGGMPWPRFLGFNALGAALWVGVWGYGVYRLGQHMEQALVLLKVVEPYLIGAGVLAVFGLLVYLLRRGNGGAP
jgi:membrane protein DedA with SNARE-associated domain